MNIVRKQGINMINSKIQKLIEDYTEILDQDPLDQMEDTQTILTRFTKELFEEFKQALVD